MKSSIARSMTGLGGLAALLGILIAANHLVASLALRRDLTGEKLYTLSDGTQELLGRLERDVTLKFYYSRSLEGLPAPLKQYATRIQDLLGEYEKAGQGRLVLEVYDPRPDSDDEEWAQKYGVSGQPIDPLGSENFYLGLVAVAGSRDRALPFLSPSDEPRLEYLISRLVQDAVRGEKPTVGVLSSLPVMGMGMNPMMMRRGPEPWLFVNELRRQYNVVPVEPHAESVSEDIDTLVVVHPQELSEGMLYAIDQFVLRGGRLLAFVDPVCLSDEQAGMQRMSMTMPQSDLNRLTQAWGVTLREGQLAADDLAASRLRGRDGRAEMNAAWLSLRRANMNADDLAAGSLDNVMLPFAGAFAGEPVAGLKMDVLMKTAPGAGLVSAMEASMGLPPRSPTSEPLPLPLAVRLTGTFPSAFPSGAPGTNAVAGLTNSVKEGVVILVADADLLNDQFAARALNILPGQSVYELANDNLVFLLNAVEQLCGSPLLIGLRSRGTSMRPFDRVLDLQAKAQARWRAEEEKLQEKLQDTQNRLNELENRKSGAQQFVLTPEQRKEIEAFRQQQADTRRQLKDVRKNLRAEIESLGMKLKAVNMALMPLLVAAFGVVHGLRRRARASS